MRRLFLIAAGLLGLCASMVIADPPPKSDPAALARLIDVRIMARLATEKVTPAGRTSDAEFLRRVSIDLIGRIPKPAEVTIFLAQSEADKRSRLVERLLQDPQHFQHFARTWRSLLLPEIEVDPQVRYFQPGFEAWLEQRRREGAGIDSVVRELLSVPIAGPDETPQFVLRDLKKPNPIAFIAAKNADPAKIASDSIRLFLGLRMECAQCHDHPFDHWTRKQFWNQAAFFAGIERKNRGTFAPLVEMTDRRTLSVTGTTDVVPALFLDAPPTQTVNAEANQSLRPAFAEWLTSSRNPFFSRALVNRIWGQFFGNGFVDPVDDFRDSTIPSHPELLQELADAFTTSGYDVGLLFRAICLSDTYQRSSRQTGDMPVPPELFARMAIRPLSPDQFVDSLAQAIGLEDPPETGRDPGEESPNRRRLIGLFGDSNAAIPETSVAQALALMNGNVVNQAASGQGGERLKQVRAANPVSTDKQIEALFLATLSRLPEPAELEPLRSHVMNGPETERPQRLGDVFWTLLNTPEFRWNH